MEQTKTGTVPPFVLMDKKQREEFLSQIGISVPAQRSLFHELCDSWVSLIDYKAFIGPRSAANHSAAADFTALLNRLKELRMAVVLSKKDASGDRYPEKIVLTEEADQRYWYHFLAELFQTGIDNPRNPFLTESWLKSKGQYFPYEKTTEIEKSALVKSTMEELAKTETVCALNLGPDRILAPGKDLGVLLAFASAKIRYHLKNADAVTAISRLMNSSLTDITSRLDSKDAGFWKTLTGAILGGKDDLLNDRKSYLDRHFIHAADIFHAYMENQITELKKQKEETVNRENDMKEVEQLVLQDKEVVVSPDDLDTHIRLLFKDKYGEGFKAFREDFFRLFTQSNSKTALPVLIQTQVGFVHRNNFYTHFLARFDRVDRQISSEFNLRMDRILRTRNRDGDVTFVTPENLEAAIEDVIKEVDELVWEVLKKPKLLAEAMIHYGKTVINMKSIDEIKNIMEQFFKPGTMVYKKLRTIFNVNSFNLFENAFKKLPIFLQFWIRLTGQYESNRSKYIGAKGEPGNPRSKSFYDPAAPVSQGGGRSSGSGDSSGRGSKNQAAKQARGHLQAAVPPPKPKPKTYSQKEQESAWSEFGRHIKKDQ